MPPNNSITNPTSKVYIFGYIFTGVAVIIAALIGAFWGHTKGETTGQEQAATTISELKSTIGASNTQSLRQTQVTLASPIAAGIAPTQEATKEVFPTVSPTIEPRTSPPTPEPPKPTPECKPGCVLYQADWSSGANGWPETFGWKHLNDMLLNDGSNVDTGGGWKTSWIPAPYQAQNLADYAVEAEIQLVEDPICGSVGVVARGTYQAGVFLCGGDRQVTIDGEEIGEIKWRDFSPGNDWHKYRLEAKGNTLKVLIDGAVMLNVTNNRYLSGEMVGLWCEGTQISVRSFKVIKL